MQVHKWYLLLMRMVSPQTVGLILFYLIGVSTSLLDSTPKEKSYLHHKDYLISRDIQLRGTLNPQLSAATIKNSNKTQDWGTQEHATTQVSFSTPSLPKTEKEHGQKLIPNLFQRLYKNSERKWNSSSDRTFAYPKEKTTVLSSKRLPVFTRPSDNNIKSSMIANRQSYQIKPSEFLLNPNLISEESEYRSSLKNLLESLFPFKIADVSYDTSSDITLNEILKQLEFLPPVKNENNISKDLSRDASLLKNESKSVILIANINGDTQHFTNEPPKHSRVQNSSMILDALDPVQHSAEDLPTPNRRKGRHFEVSGSKSREGREVNPVPVFLARIRINGDPRNISETPSVKPEGLFNYTYQLSALERGSLYPHDPFQSQDENKIFPTTLKTSQERNSNESQNLTIYEILKPRLRSTLPSNFDNSATEESESNTFSYDAVLNPDTNQNATTENMKQLEGKTNMTETMKATTTAQQEVEITTRTTLIAEDATRAPIQNSSTTLNFTDSVNPELSEIYNLLNHNVSVSSSNGTAFNSSSLLLDSNVNNIKTSEYHSESSSGVSKNAMYENLLQYFGEYFVPNSTLSKDPENSQELSDEENDFTFYNKDLVFPEVHNSTLPMDEGLSVESSETITQMSDKDLIRRPKMTDTVNTNNTPFKRPKLDPKVFYDYFAKLSSNMSTHEFPYPEYRPGNLFRYSDLFQRKPILDVVYTRPPPVFEIFTTKKEVFATEEPEITPTTFDSVRTSVRVSSTFYPNRMQDVTLKFGNHGQNPTTLPTSVLRDGNEDEHEDLEYRDNLDTGFTMEKLAYLLIGTCCGLSILCLCVVAVAIKCRRVIVEKRLKSQFRRRLYQHERMKDGATPWQREMFNHFMYLHRHPESSSSSADSCNCRCVTWSLGARNLDSSRPICPTNRSSLYLCGQKKLPFGAASTLRYESMLGRKRPSPGPLKSESPNTDSSHENDSLDQDSDSREGDPHRQCTCIEYNVWPVPPNDIRRGYLGVFPGAGRCRPGECSRSPMELRSISRDVPPPVTGSNYLDRSEGVVYWSSNDERLI